MIENILIRLKFCYCCIVVKNKFKRIYIICLNLEKLLVKIFDDMWWLWDIGNVMCVFMLVLLV